MVGSPGTTPSDFSNDDPGSLLTDNSLVGGRVNGGGDNGYHPDATEHSDADAIAASSGLQRYLEAVSVLGEAEFDCTAVPDGGSVLEQGPGNSPEGDATPAFIDLDANGEPDLCQLRRGDLDLSGEIDAGVLALLLMMIGDAPALGIGDLDEDGAISASDLQMVAGRVQSSEHCSAA
jgi:hypothetical protein